MKKSILFLLFAMMIGACEGSDNLAQDKPMIGKDYVNVISSLELSGEGQETALTIEANCEWTIQVSAEWLTVSSLVGSNTQTVSLLASKNTTGNTRTAVITITGGMAPKRLVTVTQSKSTDEAVETKTLSASPSELSFEAEGGTKELTIKSNTNWTITYPEWCILSNSSGSGNAVITVTAQANLGKEQRTGKIIIIGNETPSVTILLIQNIKTEGTQKEPGADDNQPPT